MFPISFCTFSYHDLVSYVKEFNHFKPLLLQFLLALSIFFTRKHPQKATTNFSKHSDYIERYFQRLQAYLSNLLCCNFHIVFISKRKIAFRFREKEVVSSFGKSLGKSNYTKDHGNKIRPFLSDVAVENHIFILCPHDFLIYSMQV